MNANFLAPYGEDITYTPNIAEFAERSLVFARHQTEAGQSGTAFASIFTGSHAVNHGIYIHPAILRNELLLLSEHFQDNGYEVATWLDHPMASDELGFTQGVEPANVVTTPAARGLTPDHPRFRKILDRLANDQDYKALVITNFTVTHDYVRSYLTPFCARYPDECSVSPEDVGRYSRVFQENRHRLQWDYPRIVSELDFKTQDVERLAEALELLYKSSVAELDSLFGLVLKKLESSGVLDQSLVVFSADHGEALYRDNASFKWTHGMQLAPEVLNVPLIVYGPAFGIDSGSYQAVTRSIDLLPTLGGLIGSPVLDDRIQGVDLSAAWRGEINAPRVLAFSHSTLPGPPEFFEPMKTVATMFPVNHPTVEWVSVRDADLNYKRVSDDGRIFRTELYDLKEDPWEVVDLFDPEDPQHRKMNVRLRRYKDELVSAYDRVHGLEADLDRERQLELLRSLGYIN